MTESSARPSPDFDPERIVERLNAHDVRYVVIGAVAALAHGAPIRATFDVDLTPARDPENLARLSDSLRGLGSAEPFHQPPGLLSGQEVSVFARLSERPRMPCSSGTLPVPPGNVWSVGLQSSVRMSCSVPASGT